MAAMDTGNKGGTSLPVGTCADMGEHKSEEGASLTADSELMVRCTRALGGFDGQGAALMQRVPGLVLLVLPSLEPKAR